MVKTGKFHGVERNEVGLKFLPQPDFLEFTLPDTHHVLVTNEGSTLTTEVIAHLKNSGKKAVVLNLPGIPNPIAENAVTLSAHGDEAVKEAMLSIQQQFGKTGGFIHLHPHFEFQHGNFTQHFKTEKEILKSLFFLAKHLQAELNEFGKNHRATFLTVTRMDGKLGHGKRGNVSVIGGGITGLVKCLNLEWSPVFCRAVDVQPELSTETIAAQIIKEFHDPNAAVIEVAFGEQGRKTTDVKKIDVAENQMIKTKVRPESVFLVSGGARGVTASCVIEMAKIFQCKFILLGRSAFDFKVPEFAKKEKDEATLKRLIMTDLKEKGEQPSLQKVKSIFNEIIAKKEIDHTILQIENAGGKVEYLQGDVTDLAGFKPSLDQLTRRFGAVTGIIHGAGRLADKFIQDKTTADFKNVLSVKLDGMLSLIGAIDPDKLEHLILFSSVAGFYGNVGQTDYAIANEILSKAAHLFKTNHPKTQVSAINWGAWDSGMVSGELKAQFEAAGVTLVNSEGGAAMMVNELNVEYADQPQVIIGGTLPAAVSYIGKPVTHKIRRQLKLENNPFLTHHVIKNNAVLPVVNAIGWMAQSCEAMYPDFTVFKIENTRLYKGIIFDGKEKENYILELKELEKSRSEIIFETTIYSEGEKLPVFHYKSKVSLVNKKSIPGSPKFNHQVSGNFQPESAEHIYTDGSLFHKKYFQGIEEILDCTDKQIVLSCKAPEVPLVAQGQFQVQSINTFFTDIQYQGMLIWVQKNKEGSNSLPLQTDQAVFYRNIPFDKKLLVNVKVQEATDFKMVADCTVYDEQGEVYMQTYGAALTISKELVW